MPSKRFKYAEYLIKYPNCPETSNQEYDGLAFRWLHRGNHEHNFKPVMLINPSRTFENDTLYCSGYALSMFKTEEGALEKYKLLVGKKKMLKDRLGTLIGIIKLDVIEGIATEPEQSNFGHFDYYEYEQVDLSLKILNFVEIFDENGEFTR